MKNKRKSNKLFTIILGAVFGVLIIGSVVAMSEKGSKTTSVGITILDKNSADVEWSPDGEFIAYAKVSPFDGYHDIWVIRPDGTERRCLTCRGKVPQKQNGGVTWHPSGEFIIFTAQNDDAEGERADALAKPGTGLNCNLWAVGIDGDFAVKLTDIKTDLKTPCGVIHPQFSNDGKRLFWTESLGRDYKLGGKEWGEWMLKIGDVEYEGCKVNLKNVKTISPGAFKSFYESHNFSANDTKVLFSGNLISKQPLNGLDIYEYEIKSGALKRLTPTLNDWDEHAHYSPTGNIIVWMSGEGLDVKFGSVHGHTWRKYVKTELWSMATDGTNRKRLTFFNEPGSNDNRWFRENVFETSRVVVSDSSFSPDGKRLAVTIAYEGPQSKRYGNIRSVFVVLDIDSRISGF